MGEPRRRLFLVEGSLVFFYVFKALLDAAVRDVDFDPLWFYVEPHHIHEDAQTLHKFFLYSPTRGIVSEYVLLSDGPSAEDRLPEGLLEPDDNSPKNKALTMMAYDAYYSETLSGRIAAGLSAI